MSEPSGPNQGVRAFSLLNAVVWLYTTAPSRVLATDNKSCYVSADVCMCSAEKSGISWKNLVAGPWIGSVYKGLDALRVQTYST